MYFLDAVVIGASSVKQLKENLQSTKNGPLHEGMYSVSSVSLKDAILS